MNASACGLVAAPAPLIVSTTTSRELRARQPTDEITASHVASELHPAQLAIDCAPRHGWAFATPPIPSHDAVSLQPLCRDDAGQRAVLLVEVMRWRRAPIQE